MTTPPLDRFDSITVQVVIRGSLNCFKCVRHYRRQRLKRCKGRHASDVQRRVSTGCVAQILITPLYSRCYNMHVVSWAAYVLIVPDYDVATNVIRCGILPQSVMFLLLCLHVLYSTYLPAAHKLRGRNFF